MVGRDEWVVALALLASAIDYDNFKDEVAVEAGPERASLYSQMWGVLRRLQVR